MAKEVFGKKEDRFNPEKVFLGNKFEKSDMSWEEALEKTNQGVRNAREEARRYSEFEKVMQQEVLEYYGEDLNKGMPSESFFENLEEKLDKFGYEAAFIANYFKDIIEEKMLKMKELH